ncbi:MAG: FAD/NAD(P)-binding oxidoreductase [Spirochaetes bacterium]|nr:MAG: FAD/NAD(P)-binding oxidoreductase [Spirochaetota bacterium]
MGETFDVAIIGAGVVGGAIARELSRYKITVALIEKEVDVSFGTSKANSGIIHAGFHSPPGSLKARLAVRGNRAFDLLAEELGFPFERRGELTVAFNDEEAEILRRLYYQGKQNKVQYMELIGKERAFQMEPNLNPDILQALYAPTAGIIGPYEYCFALVENAVENGVELILGEKVKEINPAKSARFYGEGFKIKTEKGLSINSRFIINAAGLYADEIASLVGLNDFRIFPRKGEEYLLDRRVGNLVHRVIFPVPTVKSKGMLVIPTVDGPVMVGPTADDVESKEDYGTTREGLKRVFEHAQKMIPGIRNKDVITSFAGLRPVATGNDFIIGTTKVKHFINAAGIQSPGLTASPAIAEMIRDILLHEGLKLEVKRDFNPIRKPIPRIRRLVEERDFRPVRELVRENPLYSRIVCRCENVTEAEVVDAIRRGHTTMDGIKFASRARTGRCQGGFCTARIIKILQRETGLPLEKITKKGPGSELVRGRLPKGVTV